MLVNVNTLTIDPQMEQVLGIIGGGSSPQPTRIGIGLYLINHFSFDMYIKSIMIERYPVLEDKNYGIPYGVCDSPQQFMQKLGDLIISDPRKFVVSFTEIVKAHESPEGGWRWHKWGHYIGEQKPTCEYLYNEPLIERVFTYHIYEVK